MATYTKHDNCMNFEIIAMTDSDINTKVETADHLTGVDILIDKRTIAADGQSFHLEFKGVCNVPWNHHYQTIMRGKHKGKTLQSLPEGYLRWSMKTSLERAVSLAAELKRREIVKRLTAK